MSAPDRVEWTRPLMRYVSDRGGVRSLRGIIRALRCGEIVVPEWQRGRVWTPEQQAAWCGFVLSGMPLPAIWLRQVNAGEGFRDELIDGQQRIGALLAWLEGDVPAVLPWNGSTVWCRTEQDERRLYRLTTPCLELPPHTSDAEVIDLYLALNTAGTPHTADELAKARDWLTEKTP